MGQLTTSTPQFHSVSYSSKSSLDYMQIIIQTLGGCDSLDVPSFVLGRLQPFVKDLAIANSAPSEPLDIHLVTIKGSFHNEICPLM